MWTEPDLELIVTTGGDAPQATLCFFVTPPVCGAVGVGLSFQVLVVSKQQTNVPDLVLDHLQLHGVPD